MENDVLINQPPHQSEHHTGKHKRRQPYFPFTNKRILPRCAITNLTNWMSAFNANQREKIANIGFGPVLNLKIQKVPTSLAYWLLENYDPRRKHLNLGSQTIKISPKLVRRVLGIPNGPEQINEIMKPTVSDIVVNEWRTQFPVTFKRFTITETIKNLNLRSSLERNLSDRFFILNFLVLFFSVLGETTRNSTVNQRFLTSVMEATKIKELDWCAYMIKLLNRCRKGCNPTSHFNGPALLAVGFNKKIIIIKY